MSGPIININSQTSANERTVEEPENTENPNQTLSILEGHGYTLGHQVGSGCYSKVKVSTLK